MRRVRWRFKVPICIKQLGSSWFQSLQALFEQADESWFLSYDFAGFPYVDRRAVHARGLAGDLGGAAKCPAHRCGELLACSGSGSSFHGDLPTISVCYQNYVTQSRHSFKVNVQT